ncbi:hypothetical protein HPULCUR_009427 [Helicostylum pulchrum]|uniref:Uncharacterized protein n=1 Tax=Helicostylum pulchrum TaxID=562976 RepID=A0ABP9YAE9_9FUNG
MTTNNHKQQFTASSFFTSFKNNQTKPNFGLPIGFPFLKSPSWQVVTIKNPSATTTTKTKTTAAAKNEKDDTIQQAMYILPKSTSRTSIYLQLPKFRSLSVFLRCGHASELVESWLRNPMDHIKRLSKPYHQILPSLQMSLPVTEMSLVPYRSSLLSIHFQLEHQIQTMEIIYDNLPCLFTIVCVTYNCGSVSLSIRQMESLEFMLSATTMDPFLVQCDLLPNHPVDIHRLREPSSFSLSSDYADHPLSLSEEFAVTPLLICDAVVEGEKHSSVVEFIQDEDAIVLYKENVDTNTGVMFHNPDQLYSLDEEEEIRKRYLSNDSEYNHLKEAILYRQEEDDDESCLYSSSEEYSVLDDLDTDQEEHQERDPAKVALLNLVRDTLEYIQSSDRVYSDELNRLQYKLYDYSRAAEAPVDYDYI